MRHKQKGRKLGRVKKVRTGLMRSLARALILEGGITTTAAKAKELRPYVERLITFAKKDTVASRRIVASRLGNDSESSKKLHDKIAPKYKERAGGYTRITKLGRIGKQATESANIELI